MANLAPSYGPVPFHPGPPNGRVATAGECKWQPVLPVNYTATKLIVCLVHTKKDARLAVDGGLLFQHRCKVLFSRLFSQT